MYIHFICHISLLGSLNITTHSHDVGSVMLCCLQNVFIWREWPVILEDANDLFWKRGQISCEPLLTNTKCLLQSAITLFSTRRGISMSYNLLHALRVCDIKISFRALIRDLEITALLSFLNNFVTPRGLHDNKPPSGHYINLPPKRFCVVVKVSI